MKTPTTNALRLDFVSDIMCPWCVIGYLQLKQAEAECGVKLDLHWHPFELNPKMAAGGQNTMEHIAEKYGTSPEESVKARDRLTRIGAELGFTFVFTTESRMVNSFHAHQLVEWADGFQAQHETKMALFRAHFTDARDVSDLDTLAAIAGEVGLDADAARAAIGSAKLATNVRMMEQFWTERGVQGVPAMIFASEHLMVGARGASGYASMMNKLRLAE